MKIRTTTEDMEKDLSRCPYCRTAAGIERRTPADMLGIYSKCKLCGAVGGLEIMRSTKHKDSLCLFWTCGEDAPYREEREPAAAAVTEPEVTGKGVIA